MIELSTDKIIYDIAINVIGGIVAALLLAYMFYRHKIKNIIYGLLLDARNDLNRIEEHIHNPLSTHTGWSDNIFSGEELVRKAINYECYTYSTEFTKINFVDYLSRNIGRIKSIFWITVPFLKQKMKHGDREHFLSIFNSANKLKSIQITNEYRNFYLNAEFGETGFFADINLTAYLLKTAKQICEKYNDASQNFMNSLHPSIETDDNHKITKHVANPVWAQADVDTISIITKKHREHIEEQIKFFNKIYFCKCLQMWIGTIRKYKCFVVWETIIKNIIKIRI